MFATIRRKLKWGLPVSPDNTNDKKSHFVLLFAGLLEEVLFWKTAWLSISFIAFLHVIIMICVQRQISLIQFLICFTLTTLIMDAFETWLKYKHRHTFLKKISNMESTKLNSTMKHFIQWLKKRWIDFVFVRETNHTKAFLLVNFVLGSLFFIGKYISGYTVIYLFCMFVCVACKLTPPVVKMFRHVLQDIESESELEGLMPEASEIDIKLLSIEPEKSPFIDEKQSLDYWQPEDVPIEEASDSSDNSSSLVTNFTMEKVDTLQRDVETSDSSEDEYIPVDQHHKEHLQSTLEVVEPSSTWSSSAYNAFWNITGAVASMVQTDKENKRKRISSVDSSDGFEMIDKSDLN